VLIEGKERVRLTSHVLPLLAGSVLLLGLPATTAAQSQAPDGDPLASEESPEYTVTVDNQGYRDVVVYTLRGGVSIRLGLVGARQVARLPANCADFVNRTSDFSLRAIAGGRVRLDGVSVGSCDRQIKIVIYATGLEYSTIWVR
jgi:hypothetical protein